MSVTLIAVLGAYLVFWQGYKLRERLNGLGHLGILLGLGLMLWNSVTAELSETHPHSLLAGQYINLIEHIFVAGSCVGLYLLRLGVERKTIRDRAVRRTIGGAALFSCVLAAIIAVGIIRGRLLSPTAQSYREPLGFLYPFISGCYFGTIMLMVAVWLWRYVADNPAPMRVGMRIAATGLFGFAALCFGRVVPVIVVFLGGPPRVMPFWALGAVSAAAMPLVFIGLSYPLLVGRWAALRAWRARRGTCKRASETVRTCRTAYPEIELRPAGIWERIRSFFSNHHTQARMVVESFDGLAKLLVHDAPITTPPGVAAAERLRAAVRRYDSRHARPVVSIISPAADRHAAEGGVPAQSQSALDQDIALVVALAAELRTGTDDLLVA